jgi:hypothetical protein
MIGKLEAQKMEYLKLFTGVTVKETLRFSYPVVPEAGKEVQVYKVASFTKISGIGIPEGQNDIALTLASTSSKNEENNSGSQVSGIVYLMPARAQASLTFQGKELSSATVEVMQLGTKMALPPAFKKIELDLETGGLRSIVME